MPREFGDAGIVDQDVDTAERIHGGGGKLAAICIGTDIGLHGLYLHAGLAHGICDFFGFFRAFAIIDQHIGTASGESECDTCANPRRRTCNDCNPALEVFLFHHPRLMLVVPIGIIVSDTRDAARSRHFRSTTTYGPP
jgi:hypothetical protein